MPYLSINDFKFGVDRRRPRAAGTPGTLWVLKNAHIGRGGDIERAKKFVSTFTLPAGTFGLGQVGGQLFVFGSADLAASMPVGVQYQRLQSGALTMTGVLDARVFDAKLYVIASYSDGTIRHFYNGTEVAIWQTDVGGPGVNSSSVTTLTAYLADLANANSAVLATANGSQIVLTSRTPGTAFTLGVAVTNNGADNTQTITAATPQANVAAVVEVRASGTIQITGGSAFSGVNQILGVTVNGTPLIAAPVNWTASNGATAIALAVAINNLSSTHNYVASVVGTTVTVRAQLGLGATANGRAIAVTTGGNVTVAAAATLTGGVTAVAAVAQVSTVTLGGLYESADEYVVTINGTAYRARGKASGAGTSAFVFKSRIYATANTLYYYCKLNDPTNWTDALAGFINMGAESEGSERLLCSAVYNSNVAIFSRRSIRIWDIETDPADNQYLQTLENIGAVAARSVVPYGNVDVFFLDEAGIRSLKAREVTNAAYVSDVGTTIDPFVREHILSLTRETVRKAVSVVEPVDGRYWLALGDRVYVLSYFPGSDITAWSYYEPGVSFTDFARVEDRVYARAGDIIYLYGGINGTTYPDDDEQEIQVSLPFMSAQAPGTFKRFTGVDIVLGNEWQAELLVDPNDETKTINLGVLNKITNNLPDIPAIDHAALVALNFTCSRGGNASISSVLLHYEAEDAG